MNDTKINEEINNRIRAAMRFCESHAEEVVLVEQADIPIGDLRRRPELPSTQWEYMPRTTLPNEWQPGKQFTEDLYFLVRTMVYACLMGRCYTLRVRRDTLSV